jgi:hypothetical protein
VQSTAVTPSGSGRPGVAVTLPDTRETLSHVVAPCQSIDETPDRCGAVAVEEARVAEGLEGRVLAGPLARAAGMGQAQHDHDVDMLTGLVGVGRSKNGYGRQVPMNTTVQSVLLEMATQRKQTNDPMEPVFVHAYRTVARAFKNAIQRAQAALREADREAARLDGYTWHGNRHSFASRLVMVGVDLLTVQKLGGWRTLSMVQRYGHLAPDHLRSAVERLVTGGAAVALARNLPEQPLAKEGAEKHLVEVCDPKGTEG